MVAKKSLSKRTEACNGDVENSESNRFHRVEDENNDPVTRDKEKKEERAKGLETKATRSLCNNDELLVKNIRSLCEDINSLRKEIASMRKDFDSLRKVCASRT